MVLSLRTTSPRKAERVSRKQRGIMTSAIPSSGSPLGSPRLTPAQGSVLNPSLDPSRSDWLAEYQPPRSLPLDQEALRVYERAYTLGLQMPSSDEPAITFGTVMMALLVSHDETSRWFARLATQNGPDASTVFGEYQ